MSGCGELSCSVCSVGVVRLWTVRLTAVACATVLLLGVVACAPAVVFPANTPTPFTRTSTPDPSASDLDPEISRAEMLVLDALDDEYAKAAAWFPDAGLLRVTVFSNGTSLPKALIEEYQRRASIVMGPDVTVVITVDPGGPPTPD